MQTKKFYLADENAMRDFGAKVAKLCRIPCVIYLKGQLGTGKTTFVRGFLRGFGFQGTVKSPTFTWVESYLIADKKLFHFDFFRANDIHDVEKIGLRDYFAQDAILLIEWPEKAILHLPVPDLELALTLQEPGRKVSVKGLTLIGKSILEKLPNEDNS